MSGICRISYLLVSTYAWSPNKFTFQDLAESHSPFATWFMYFYEVDTEKCLTLTMVPFIPNLWSCMLRSEDVYNVQLASGASPLPPPGPPIGKKTSTFFWQNARQK